MPEDWFEIAYINFDKAILHGRRKDQTEVEIVLTDEQKRAVEDMKFRHEMAMQKLLRGFAETQP